MSMRLILMGTGPFAVPAFEALRVAGHDIALVVTKPVPPVKSRKGPPPAPVRDWAVAHRLPIFDPENVNQDDAVQHLESVAAQLMVVCDYGRILKPAVLQTTPLGGINLHGSLLPAYRGAAPVQWAMLSGDAVTGVTVIHITPKLDAGPILVTRQTPIGDDETAGELEQRLSQLGVPATLEAVELLAAWDGTSEIGEPQDPSKVSKAPRLQKSDAQIDWGRTAQEIDCHVRGMQPWPVAYTHLYQQTDKPPLRLAIQEIQISDQASDEVEPGTIRWDSGLWVASADRWLQIKRLQPAGKREMSGEEFVRGHSSTDAAKMAAL